VDDVVVDFQWGRSEFLRLYRKRGLPRSFRRFYRAGLFTILCAILEQFLGADTAAWIFYILGASELTLGMCFIWYLPLSTWKKGKVVQGPRRLTFSNDRITVSTEVTDTSQSWELWPISEEWSDFYLLRRAKQSFPLTVPKRGFHSPEDQARFRQLLRTHTSCKLDQFALDDPKHFPSADEDGAT
jgi:hypothetical protein